MKFGLFLKLLVQPGTQQLNDEASFVILFTSLESLLVEKLLSSSTIHACFATRFRT